TRPLLSSPTTMPPGMHTLPLHVALPILVETLGRLARELRTATLAIGLQLTAYQVAVLVGVDIGKALGQAGGVGFRLADPAVAVGDRKSTRLNSSHVKISYADFCLIKKIL